LIGWLPIVLIISYCDCSCLLLSGWLLLSSWL